MEIKLKPCPFCGQKKSLVLEVEYFPGVGDTYQIVCSGHYDGCGASSSYESDEEGAVKAWNQRKKRRYHQRRRM